MISDILQSLGQLLETNGYKVEYNRTNIDNGTKVPLVQFEIKNTSVAVFQTVSNINRIDFDLLVFRACPRFDEKTLAALATLADFETQKKTLNNLFREWDRTQGVVNSDFCGFTWTYEMQGTIKEATNQALYAYRLNCSIQYMDR